MRAYIANTDYDWYRFLLARPDLDEVNFWRPGTANFQALAPGEPLLFRLKAPHDKNGVDSEQAMRRVSRPITIVSERPMTASRTTTSVA